MPETLLSRDEEELKNNNEKPGSVIGPSPDFNFDSGVVGAGTHIEEEQAPPEIRPEEQPSATDTEVVAPKKLSEEEKKIQENVAALEKLHEEHLGVEKIVEQTPEVDAEKVPELKIAEAEKEYTPKEQLLALKNEAEKLDKEIEGAKKRREDVIKSGEVQLRGDLIKEVRKLEKQKENIVKEIGEAQKEVKKQAAENLSVQDVMNMKRSEMLEAFKDVTENEKGESRHLFKERDEMVKQNLEARKMKIIPGNKIEEYRAKLIAKEKAKIYSDNRSAAKAICWARLTADQKQQFGVPDSDGFQKYLREKAEEKLGISENDFYNLVRAGIVPEQMKKRGRFMGAILGDFKVIDSRYPRPLEISKKEFDKMIAGLRDGQAEAVGMAAKSYADRMIEAGRKALRTEKDVCAKKIIEQTVADYNLEQQKERDAEAERQAAKARRTVRVPPIKINQRRGGKVGGKAKRKSAAEKLEEAA